MNVKTTKMNILLEYYSHIFLNEVLFLKTLIQSNKKFVVKQLTLPIVFQNNSNIK